LTVETNRDQVLHQDQSRLIPRPIEIDTNRGRDQSRSRPINLSRSVFETRQDLLFASVEIESLDRDSEENQDLSRL
jgi:hypothetical protein